MAHIFLFPDEYIVKDKQRPLTKLMIKTLRFAYDKQKINVLFGPKDIKGSVISLIKRGLIRSHTIKQKGKNQLTWYLTREAIEMLKSIEQKKINNN
ncbi:MAG: hypothetical protein ACRDE5_12010 [Ginsengibacter sp.]